MESFAITVDLPLKISGSYFSQDDKTKAKRHARAVIRER
jgi:hypothetical protein